MSDIPYNNKSHINSSLFLLAFMSALYILGAIIPIDGNVVNYAITFMSIFVLFIYLLFFKRIDNVHYTIGTLLVLIVVIPILLFPIIHKHDIYIRLFIIKLILLIYLFNQSNISIKSFTKIINISYLIYLGLSILTWLHLFPIVHAPNSFLIPLGSIQIETLYGVSGSTADIDAYSAIVFLWNAFIYKGKYRKRLLIISLFALLLTFRGTPLVALIVSAMTYIIVRTRFMSFIGLISIAISLIFTLIMLQNYPQEPVFFGEGEKNWYTFFWDITHARSALWNNQFNIYWNQFAWHEYIYGRNIEDMLVPFTRPDGLELEKNFNPHNSYLIILYRSTILFILLYFYFLFYAIKQFHRNTYPILFGISLVALTNSSIFGLENPIYVLMLIYIITQYKKQIQSVDSQNA